MLISSEKKKDNVNVIFFLGWLEILYTIHVVGPNSPGQIW